MPLVIVPSPLWGKTSLAAGAFNLPSLLMNFPFGLCYNALLRYLYLETTPCAPSHGYISSFLGFAVVSSPLTNDPFGLCLPSLRVLLVFLQTSKSKICKYPLPPLLHFCR